MREPALASPEEVFAKYRDHVRRLREMRERVGEENFTDAAAVQLLTLEGFLDDLARTLFPTDGHGRVLVPEDEERKTA